MLFACFCRVICHVSLFCVANFTFFCEPQIKAPKLKRVKRSTVFRQDTGRLQMALKCFLPCVFQNMWPSDNHNYALHSVVSHTGGCNLQNQQVANCFLLRVCVVCWRGLCVQCVKMCWFLSETFRQLTSNGDVFDIERKSSLHVFPKCAYTSNDRT